jgi:hypothetical protein
MSNFSPISRQEQEEWVTCRLRMLKCRKAATMAHDPRFTKMWLKKADEIHENYRTRILNRLEGLQ